MAAEKGLGEQVEFRSPQAHPLAGEVGRLGDAAGFAGDEQLARRGHELGQIDQEQARDPLADGRGEKKRAELGPALAQQLRGRGLGAAAQDAHVHPGRRVKPLGQGHVIAGKLGLGFPLRDEYRLFQGGGPGGRGQKRGGEDGDKTARAGGYDNLSCGMERSLQSLAALA